MKKSGVCSIAELQCNADAPAETLAMAWREERQPESPNEEMLPHTRAEAYRAGDAMVALPNQRTVGWNPGALLPKLRRQEGYDGPIPGRILRTSVYRSDSSIPISSGMKVEYEIAFPPAQYQPADYATEWPEWPDLLFALDITTSRHRQEWLDGLAPRRRMLAQRTDDDSFRVRGGSLTDRELYETMLIRLRINEPNIRILGARPSLFEALFGICVHARERDMPLRKGEPSITGSIASSVPADKGDPIRIDFFRLSMSGASKLKIQQ